MKKVYLFGPYKFCLPERQLWKGKKEIKLYPRHCALLLYFLENAGKLISVETLVKNVWPAEVSQSTVTSTISRFHKKLKTGAEREYIQGAPQSGYYFVCPVEEEGQAPLVIRSGAEITAPPEPPFGLFAVSSQLEEEASRLEACAAQLRDRAARLRQSAPESWKVRLNMEILNPQKRAQFCLELARQASDRLRGLEQATWLNTLEDIYEHLLDALRYFGAREETAGQQLELAVKLGHFWNIRGHWTDGRLALQDALSRQQSALSALQAQGAAWLGFLMYRQDDYAESDQWLLNSIEIGARIGDQQAQAFALDTLGLSYITRGHYKEAAGFLRESFKAGPDNASILFHQFYGLGQLAQLEGDLITADAFYNRYLSENRGDSCATAIALNSLGTIAQQSSEAKSLQQQSLTLMQGLGYKNGMGRCYRHLALIEEADGQHKAAWNLYRQALVFFDQVGNRLQTVWSMKGVARVAYAMGRPQDAARIYGAAETLEELLQAPSVSGAMSPDTERNYEQIATTIRSSFPSQWRQGKRHEPGEVVS